MASLKSALQYAWHGSGRRWDAVWIGIVGGLIGGFVIWVLGVKVPQTVLDNPLWGAVVAIALGAVTGVATVFIVRLCWAPFHFKLKPYGGFSAVSRRVLMHPFLPVILMASGLLLFVVLFGAGSVLFVIQQAQTPIIAQHENSEATTNPAVIAAPKKDAPKPEPLPTGAKFRLDDQIYWFAPKPYVAREAKDVLEVGEEFDNYLQINMVPLMQELQQYTSVLPSKIKQSNPKEIRKYLLDFDTNRLIPCFQEAMKIYNKSYLSF